MSARALDALAAPFLARVASRFPPRDPSNRRKFITAASTLFLREYRRVRSREFRGNLALVAVEQGDATFPDVGNIAHAINTSRGRHPRLGTRSRLESRVEVKAVIVYLEKMPIKIARGGSGRTRGCGVTFMHS